MNTAHRIAWEATQCLGASLELETALDAFFQHLCTAMPLKYLYIGKYAEDGSSVFILSLTARSGTKREFLSYPLTESQRILGRAYHFFDAKLAEDLFIESRAHPLGKIYEIVGLPYAYPMYVHRITYQSELFGGASFIFEDGSEVTQAMLDILRAVEAPLGIFINAWFQYWKLEQLKDQIYKENRELHRKLAGMDEIQLIGGNGGLAEVVSKVQQVAPLDVSVLIRGETGTGKEMAAKALHQFSPYKKGPFVAVNCGAIPPSLIDSELFGHVKGAFTGASTNRKGRFEQAHGGTLFLDEVAELPLELQARLLRVLEERVVERVGGGTPIPVKFRLLAATHRNLERMVGDGSFREDLYYRMSIVTLKLPPLRERRQDIPLLLRHFLENSANRFGMLKPDIPPREEARLMDYDWPGNIRELRNVVEEAVALSTRGELSFNLRRSPGQNGATEALRVISPPPAKERSKAEILPYDLMQKELLERALEACDGKIRGPGGAAELLQLNYSTLRAKLRKYGVPHGKG